MRPAPSQAANPGASGWGGPRLLAVGALLVAGGVLVNVAGVVAGSVASMIASQYAVAVGSPSFPWPFLLLFLLFFGVLATITASAACAVKRTAFGRFREVYRRPYAALQRRTERLSAPIIVAFDAAAVTFIAFFPLARYEVFAPPWITVAAMVALYAWFEVWFYVTHRLMHTRWLYFVHRRHHVSNVTHPLTSLSFSLSERVVYHLGIVLGIAGVSRVTPVPLVSVVGFLAVTYLLNVMVHCNFEVVPTWVVRSPLGKVFASVSFHAMHHARAENHYGFTSSFVDYACGTVWRDYQAVHARAAAGQGMTRLGERLGLADEPAAAP